MNTTTIIYCTHCGSELASQSQYCLNCGKPTPMNPSNKSSIIALILCALFGILGIHRVYLGRIGSGLLILCLTMTVIFIFVPMIWSFIDLIRIICNDLRDNHERTLVTEHKTFFKILSIIIICIMLSSFVAITMLSIYGINIIITSF